MKEKRIRQAYELAKEQYAAIGVDTEKVLESLQDFPCIAGRRTM